MSTVISCYEVLMDGNTLFHTCHLFSFKCRFNRVSHIWPDGEFKETKGHGLAVLYPINLTSRLHQFVHYMLAIQLIPRYINMANNNEVKGNEMIQCFLDVELFCIYSFFF